MPELQVAHLHVAGRGRRTPSLAQGRKMTGDLDKVWWAAVGDIADLVVLDHNEMVEESS